MGCQTSASRLPSATLGRNSWPNSWPIGQSYSSCAHRRLRAAVHLLMFASTRPGRASRRPYPITIFNTLPLASVTLAAAALLGGSWTAVALTPAGELAAHRAIYQLKLAKTTGKGGAVAARGRILYDF